ncbi:MAG: Asp-tRNA(Asn)/Glu-tRNA(Gln) amidotransferase GatCAB subunit C, partial [Frankia sp.]|nr:Asp-tRNA(Asn)/Glu-tRNA(Gln) amidotransferase GatCAB subunit C [Frankia sp.]
TEELIVRLWREALGVELTPPFPRLTYAESMARFGNDKPDMRFGYELIDLSQFYAATQVAVFRATLDVGGHVGGVLVPDGAALTRKELDAWVDWAKGRGGKGLAWVAIQSDGSLRSPLAKFFSAAESGGFADVTGASPGDLVFLVADARPKALALLGALRLAVARERGLIDESLWRFVWVTEAPMFEPTDSGGWTAVHHPFTAPTPEWESRFADDPEHALARAYDIVGNGMELGGGSIRIHRAELQSKVFDVIGLTPELAREQFGFLLDAFDYGPPPHGGIAFGIDRLVATIAGTEAIRDVIAFPKTASGADPLTGAPTPITAVQRKEAGIDAKPVVADA